MWFFCGNTGLFFRDMGLFFSHMGLFCRHNLWPTSSTRFVVCDYCRVTWSEDIIIEGTRRRYNYIYRCVYIYIYREREREREIRRVPSGERVVCIYTHIYIYTFYVCKRVLDLRTRAKHIYMWLYVALLYVAEILGLFRPREPHISIYKRAYMPQHIADECICINVYI